jgi:PilZ domain
MASLPLTQQLTKMHEAPVKSGLVDRRKRQRSPVHWLVSFPVAGTNDLVQTVTQDISSDGFYCIVNARFAPGEIRHCTLMLPTHNEIGHLPVLCKVRVIRVTVTAERGFCGIACQIIDYRLVNSCPNPEVGWATEPALAE